MPVAAAGAVFKAPACSQGRLIGCVETLKPARLSPGGLRILWAQLVGDDYPAIRYELSIGKLNALPAPILVMVAGRLMNLC